MASFGMGSWIFSEGKKDTRTVPGIRPGRRRLWRKGWIMRALIRFVVSVMATAIAAVAVVLPWDLRIRYARLLRWFRNKLMQHVGVARRWALARRWEWDDHEA
jgi:hypothetical protein